MNADLIVPWRFGAQLKMKLLKIGMPSDCDENLCGNKLLNGLEFVDVDSCRADLTNF